MRKSEKTFWRLLKSHLPKGCDHQRIETGSTGRGIPDVNLCKDGVEIWVELKVVIGRSIDLSPEQVAWHYRRNAAGGTTWIMARDVADGARKGKYDRIYLWCGSQSIEVKKQGVDAPGAFVFESPYEWDKIMDKLFGVVW
jgi:hypothetical protein|tara:strand:- start:1071 stop:1490 length:420 start_codon:yes stop_codon:yes gene_type:complete